MLKVLWNIVKYFLGIFHRIVYPAKRLICRRRKNSASDIAELTSIGTGDGPQMKSSVSGSLPHNGAELEMEPWDSWADAGDHGHQERQAVANGQAPWKGNNSAYYHHMQQQQQQQMEPELQLNFFEDMTPNVQKQKKFLIRKKEAQEQSTFSNRLAVTSDVPLQTSELESWEDTGSAWEDNPESAEDLSWQAEEAIREKRRKDRMERQMEQQKKKQKKDEMRGIKGGSLAATKLS